MASGLRHTMEKSPKTHSQRTLNHRLKSSQSLQNGQTVGHFYSHALSVISMIQTMEYAISWSLVYPRITLETACCEIMVTLLTTLAHGKLDCKGKNHRGWANIWPQLFRIDFSIFRIHHLDFDRWGRVITFSRKFYKSKFFFFFEEFAWESNNDMSSLYESYLSKPRWRIL